MGRCPPEMLDDLASVLAEIRTWPRIVERKPLVFYLGSEPFLHFHLLAGDERRADVKSRTDWTSFELPRPLPETRRRALLRCLRDRHRERLAGKGNVRWPSSSTT